jgi:hypothetical protein
LLSIFFHHDGFVEGLSLVDVRRTKHLHDELIDDIQLEQAGTDLARKQRPEFTWRCQGPIIFADDGPTLPQGSTFFTDANMRMADMALRVGAAVITLVLGMKTRSRSTRRPARPRDGNESGPPPLEQADDNLPPLDLTPVVVKETDKLFIKP